MKEPIPGKFGEKKTEDRVDPNDRFGFAGFDEEKGRLLRGTFGSDNHEVAKAPKPSEFFSQNKVAKISLGVLEDGVSDIVFYPEIIEQHFQGADIPEGEISKKSDYWRTRSDLDIFEEVMNSYSFDWDKEPSKFLALAGELRRRGDMKSSSFGSKKTENPNS